VIRRSLHTVETVGFSSSLTIVARMNMSSPTLSVHPVDSQSSSAVMTGLHTETSLAKSKCKSSNLLVNFFVVLKSYFTVELW